MEYVTLLGSEAVEQAGHRMAGAAESFQRSVGYLEQILTAHSSSIESSVARLEALLEEKK